MKILELTLLTYDLDETIVFYTEILGFTLLWSDMSSASFKAGSTKLTFIQTHKEGPLYHFTFNIPDNKLYEALAFIGKKAVVLAIEGNSKFADFTDWNARSVYFNDNNRNILEFIARFDLNDQSNDSFDAAQIRCISEIGIVTDNVPEECERLIAGKGLDYFSKQTPREDFTALGDDHGLILLTQKGRLWFPTNIPAEKYPTIIKCEMNGRVEELKYYD